MNLRCVQGIGVVKQKKVFQPLQRAWGKRERVKGLGLLFTQIQELCASPPLHETFSFPEPCVFYGMCMTTGCSGK